MNKNGKEACYWLGDSRETIVMFIDQKYLFQALKSKQTKKMLMSVNLPSIKLEKNRNLFLSHNFSD